MQVCVCACKVQPPVLFLRSPIGSLAGLELTKKTKLDSQQVLSSSCFLPHSAGIIE